MTSAGSPLSRGALGTQPGAVEERGGRRAAPALRELPRREASEDVPNRGKGHRRPQVPCRPFHHPPPAGSGLAPRPPPWGEVREATWQSGHRTQVVPLFSGLGSPREVGGWPGAFALVTGAPSGRLRERRSSTAWEERSAAPTRGAHAPTPTRSRTHGRAAKAQALLLLFFFISLFHIHISHSMEKPERVRQRWYNRSAVTGAGRGGAERGQTGWLPTCIPLGH